MNIERFTEYVDKIEQDHLIDMFVDIGKTEKQAHGCGCLNCQKVANSTKEAFYKEYLRVYGSGPDHEEDRLTEYALSKINGL